VKYSKSIDRLSLQSQIRDIIASGAKCSVAISSNPQSHTHNVIASTAQAGRGNLYMPMVSPGSHLDCFVAALLAWMHCFPCLAGIGAALYLCFFCLENRGAGKPWREKRNRASAFVGRLVADTLLGECQMGICTFVLGGTLS